MRKRLLLLVLCLAMVLGNLTGLGYVDFSANAASSQETVSYLDGSDLLYDLMEYATTFVVAQHKALGGSHYAYTEGLYEESTGEAASGVGTEMNFQAGSRLVLLTLEQEGDKVKKTEKVLLTMAQGCIRDPDVSADGTKCIFSMKKNNSDDFHIYEMELTSGEYKYEQLTFGSGVADFECMYLPNGEILFSSSRIVQTVDCWKTPVSNIFKMAADGSNIIRLGYDQVHTTYPTLTEDGRVIYTRWDYNDRTQMWIQSLFQMNPDGTNQTELYGNNSNFPTTLTHTRQVPGESSLYVSIATGHHTYQAGKLCLIDVSDNRDGKASVTFPFDRPATNDNIDGFGQDGAMYQYPYPINSTQLLVSYAPNGWASDRATTAFGIWFMDTTNRNSKIEIMAGTSQYPAAQIVPVKTRDMFIRPSMVNYAVKTGTYYVADVYQGEAMEGVERGTVKQLRVVALDFRAYAVGATVAAESGSSDPYTPVSTGNGSWDVKVVLGVATVYEDGSAMFTVPSETPVYFQLLDKDGNMIQTMRSWSTLMPNEIYSCVGCHEDNNTAPPAASTVTMALRAGIETLKPDAWQADEADEKDYDPYTSKIGFDYLEEVQPILDAKCISCHNNKNASYNKINAVGMNESGVTMTAVGTEEQIFGTGETWEYYISASNNPASGWNNTGFTGNWTTGKAGFGDRSDKAPVGTTWNNANNWIFIRKTFTINDLSKYEGAVIKLNTFYDDTPVFYLNGQVIYTNGENWVDQFTTLLIDGKSNLLKEGENVLAISINQHTGGRYIDCGLSVVIPDDSDPNAKNPFSLEGEGIGSQRMSRYFPLSYLVLTASYPHSGIQWVGIPNNQYTHWLSSMSAPEVQPANMFGATASNLMKILRDGHAGVKLTDTELRTIAAWIDLCVPAYGSYDANNHWDANEYREAEEEQNKRDYYTMQNDYTRLALAGLLPEGTIEIEYLDKNTNKTYTDSARGIVNLYFPGRIQTGDTVTVTLPEGVKYFAFTLTPKMGESIVYCPDGTFTYVVPNQNYMVTSISKTYANTTNYITARLLTDDELAAKRNLAENAYDYTNNASTKSDITGQYPHATASSEWENSVGEPHFYARNAIDGFRNNVGHGAYPVQSWGPANSGSQWIEIDFGRAVNAEELGIVVRYDTGHDTYFKSAVVQVTYEDGTTGTQNITIEFVGTEQIFKLEATKPITKLRLRNLVSAQSGGWAAFTEIAVYGSEVVK